MQTTLIILIALGFFGLLVVNIYFRVKVFTAYKQLVRSGVDFKGSDILDRERIEQIIQRNPRHEATIRTFTNGIRSSVLIACGLIVLITLLGGVLMWFR